MSQTTEIQIQNQNGLSFRTKLNQMLSALNTVFAGTTAPTVTEANMLWMDTSVSPNVLKRRNSSNTAWEVVPLVESATLAAASKDTPVDADLLPLVDSASSNILKKLTWASAKSTLKSYLDGFYIKLSGGNLTGPLNYTFGADMASASTVDLSLATGNSVRITGTTTINSFGTAAQNGTLRIVRFTGVLTITHQSGGGIAGDIFLPGYANITTQVGDTAIFVKNPTGVWITASYLRADGTSIAGGLANQRMSLTSAVATTSSTAIDFTGIPSWAKKITVQLNGVSTNGASNYQVQLGTSSGIVSSGYESTGDALTNASAVVTQNLTSGFLLIAGAGSVLMSGALRLHQLGGTTWVADGKVKLGTTTTVSTAGDVTLPAVLDRIRITTINGTDTFDGGSISLLIEGY